MSSLIEDVIDLARSRLGGKIPLAPSMEPLEPLLKQVVDEMRATHPQRRIEAEFVITRPVFADRQRIARLLSNLFGNALSPSAAETPVFVRARKPTAVFRFRSPIGARPFHRPRWRSCSCLSCAGGIPGISKVWVWASSSFRRLLWLTAARSMSLRRTMKPASRFKCRSSSTRDAGSASGPATS